MCGRYTVYTEAEVIEMRSILSELDRKFGMQPPHVEVRPTNTAAVIDRFQQVQAAKWGFPKWDNKGVIINARCESALEKPMFQKPLLTSRCAIPATGFFEWYHTSDGKASKEKYLCRIPKSDMLYMAGATKEIRDDSGDVTIVFVILTTEAVDPIRSIHNRMPVILRKEEIGQWLTDLDFVDVVFNRKWRDLELIQIE